MTTRPLALPLRATLVACAALFLSAVRPPDIPFRIRMLDGGASETAAVADINRDGRLDIVSGENWYEAPAWTKHPFRELELHQQLRRQLQRPGGGCQRRRLSRHRVGDLVRAEDLAGGRTRARRGASGPKPRSTPGFPVEFALLVDIDNDGKAQELLPQAGTTQTPLAWYEARDGTWVKHVVSAQSYGHGIGAGDVNKDGRTDILTPRGWLEAPADPRPAHWTFHADWESVNLPVTVAPAAPGAAPAAPPRVTDLGFMHVARRQRRRPQRHRRRRRRTTTACSGSSRATAASGPAGRSTPPGRRRHASTLVDLNGDGQPDLVTGKRFMAHNGSDPGEREPLGVYWFEHRPAQPRPRARRPASSGSATSSTSAAAWAAACRFRSSISTATAISTSSAPARADCSWRRT